MLISCDNISKTLGGHPVLTSLTFSLEAAHALVLIGPSGSGKSSLLRVLAGLLTPDTGSASLNGQTIPTDEAGLRLHRQRLGVVFQAFNLFPHLTALQNVQLPLRHVHRMADAEERARAALKRFRLEKHADKRPGQLSGGERQRVAIARALAADPEVLLMDEPTSALDPEMTGEVLDVVASLRDAGKPLILATHEMGFARRVGDAVLFLTSGQVREAGDCKKFFAAPETAEARQFLARILKYE